MPMLQFSIPVKSYGIQPNICIIYANTVHLCIKEAMTSHFLQCGQELDILACIYHAPKFRLHKIQWIQ